MVGNQAHDLLYGGDGDDTIWGDWYGSAGSYAGTYVGDDVMYGNGGADYMTGQEGNDTLYGGAGDDQVYGYLRLTNGGVPGQNIYFYDHLFGGAGNDYLGTASGADQLTGGQGDDTLSGGDNNDLYLLALGDGSDRIVEAGGSDTISLGSGIASGDLSYSRVASDLIITTTTGSDDITIRIAGQYSGAAVETLVLADTTVIDLTALTLPILGTSSNDILTGGSGADTLDGLAGNDQIGGGAGDDTLYGGDDADTLFGHSWGTAAGSGNDLMFGGAGNDWITGDDGADKAYIRQPDGPMLKSIGPSAICQAKHRGITPRLTTGAEAASHTRCASDNAACR